MAAYGSRAPETRTAERVASSAEFKSNTAADRQRISLGAGDGDQRQGKHSLTRKQVFCCAMTMTHEGRVRIVSGLTQKRIETKGRCSSRINFPCRSVGLRKLRRGLLGTVKIVLATQVRVFTFLFLLSRSESRFIHFTTMEQTQPTAFLQLQVALYEWNKECPRDLVKDLETFFYSKEFLDRPGVFYKGNNRRSIGWLVLTGGPSRLLDLSLSLACT